MEYFLICNKLKKTQRSAPKDTSSFFCGANTRMISSWITYILVMKQIQVTLAMLQIKTWCSKMFYFEQFSLVQTSEGFSVRDILYWKTYSIFPIMNYYYYYYYYYYLTVTFALDLCNFDIVENTSIAGTAF